MNHSQINTYSVKSFVDERIMYPIEKALAVIALLPKLLFIEFAAYFGDAADIIADGAFALLHYVITPDSRADAPTTANAEIPMRNNRKF